MDIFKIIGIFKEKDKFLSLSEIYEEYKARYSVEGYVDYRAALRNEINRNCADRALNLNDKRIFVSLNEKGKKGQLIGLYEWMYSRNFEDSVTNKNLINYQERIISSVQRNLEIKKKALERARYCCEIDSNHVTFERKSDGTQYTEVHHIIPLEYQKSEEFKNINLDCLTNVISLCCNCHNELHYGKNPERILKVIFDKRRKEFYSKGIYITLDRLFDFYK